ncbi:metal ABC transporter permease [Clostridium akagii]|uniref:metal ABC transporter permease n=1 Tax=Clostridium akagii TaxID=91623 RepID=UPI0004794E18|nr:metal ABC transporter permease [Clostridium akagii]
MKQLSEIFFAPGFFQNSEVINALILSVVVAAISGVIGVFVIIRGQTFAGHAISDFGGAGAAIAFLIGINTLWGFLSFGVLAAIGMETLGNESKERNLSTGIVLSVALGIESLFLYLDTHFTGKSNASMLILFGSIFVVDRNTVLIVAMLTIATAIIICIIYRPLLLCSIEPEIAKTRGISVRFINIIFVILLSFVVEEGSLITGALLSTALLIGPAAAAMQITRKMSSAIVLSAGIGIIAMWLGIILAYDSFLWPPTGRGWTVSFFVSTLILLFYLLARLKHKLYNSGIIKTEGVLNND